MDEENTAVSVNEEKKEQPTSITSTLDEQCLTLLKSEKPANRYKLNLNTIDIIAEQVQHGVSMTTACLYAGISPTTGFEWFSSGQREIEALTDEQIQQQPEGLEDLLTLKGVFYLKTCRQRANCVVEIHNMLYERAFESGKEWIATYLLERTEPEKYNLKYKVQQEVNANVSANVVEFKFVDGMNARPVGEAEFIQEQVQALKDKYSEHDIVIDADASIVEEGEEDDK